MTNNEWLYQSEDLCIKADEWFTMNSYDSNFKNVPNKSGVYLLVSTEINLLEKSIKNEILYIGSAKDLQIRYSKHSTYRALKNMYDYVRFYFIETANYLQIEKSLIQKIKPRFNIQYAR